MKIRNFTCKDVDALIDCWNHALPHDTVQKSHFIKKLVLDVNFDPNGFFIVEEAEMILGFINCVYRKVAIDGYSGLEENDGWISAFRRSGRNAFTIRRKVFSIAWEAEY